MEIFRLSFRVYRLIMVMVLSIIAVDWLVGGFATTIYTFIFGIFIILVFIDTFKTKIIVEDDRLMYKQSFRTRYLFWKEVKAIGYERGVKDYQHIIWVLTEKDISSFNRFKAICIRFTIKDFEELVKIIYERCKDNPDIKIAPEVLNLIKVR